MTEKKEKPMAEAAEMDLSDEESLNLFQRISAIRGEVTAVERADVGQGKGVLHDDVTRMLRPLMYKHGVVSFLSLEKSEMVDTGVVYGNTKRALMQLRSVFIVTYVNVDDSCERLQVSVEAHADDSGDKAPGKCASYAQKYADLKTFAVPTGEDDEDRIPEDKITVPVETLTEAQIADMWAKADEYFGDDATDILTGLAKAIFSVDGYIQIESKYFQTALDWLDTKKAKLDKQKAAA